MIIVNLEQGSEAWFKEKLGKPSASNASMIITNDGKPSKQRTGYMFELAAERISGHQEETYKNCAMDAGIEKEDEGRKYYSLITNEEVIQVGVVYKDARKRYLCSPDSLLKNKKEGLEIKCPLQKTQAKYLFFGELPSEYFGQVQFSLMVTGFDIWNFLCYTSGMNPLLLKVKRDEKYINSLEKELEIFCDELDVVCKKIG
jgi:hypothetical protein